jgi:UDP-N-acetylmuramate--alanine ligase
MPRRHIHFIGIGGAGLSALARVMLGRGEVVSGSDPTAPTPLTDELEKLGATIYAAHDARNIHGADLIVTTSAARGDNPEIVAAHLQHIPILKRREFLRDVTRGYDVIAVAGSHGKTTTTAQLALVLEAAGLDPTVVVGGIVPGWQTNARVAENPANRWFVIEADEYDYAFWGLEPKIAVVTNVDYDHPDLFPTREAYRDAFGQFLKQTRADGVSITCADEHGLKQLAESNAPHVICYGTHAENDWRATNVQSNARGGTDFAIYRQAQFVGTASLQVPGEHNALNALAALIAANTAGVAIETALATLAQFGGVGRRFQVVGSYNGATLVDDYAHHPSEIRATLHGARMRFPNQRIWALFQPHTFSRTRALLDEFAEAFGDADKVLIAEIYAAREQNDSGLSARAILERMHHQLLHPDARYVETLDTAQEILRKELCPGDVLITLGAGNVNRVAQVLKDNENA